MLQCAELCLSLPLIVRISQFTFFLLSKLVNHAIIQYKRFFYRQSIKSFIHQMAVHKGDLGGSNKVRITNF